MPNPNPRQTETFLNQQYQPIGAEPLGKVIGTRFPKEISDRLGAMSPSERSDFIRAAVAKAFDEMERSPL